MGFQTHLLLKGVPFSSNQRDENQLKIQNTLGKSYYYYFTIGGMKIFKFKNCWLQKKCNELCGGRKYTNKSNKSCYLG